MALLRQFEELSIADKVYHLHTRHTKDIKAFLYFMTEHIIWLLEDDQRINIPCPCTDGPSWSDLLPVLHSDKANHYDDYVERPAYFIQALATGKNKYFFLYGIRQYRDLTSNPIFKKAIQYWFDC
jgi:hypothetical protein